MTRMLADSLSLLPQVNTYTRHVQAGDPAAVLGCVDWLLEQDATLGDVLVLYAGRPTRYEDGLAQAVLHAWCKVTEPEKRCSAITVPNWGAVLDETASYQLFCPRWQAVTRIGINWERIADQVNDLAQPHRRDQVSGDDIRKAVEHGGVRILLGPDIQAAYWREVRNVKRQVLALFPEVRYNRRHTVSLRGCNSQKECNYRIAQAEKYLHAKGWHPTTNLACEYGKEHHADGYGARVDPARAG